MKLNESYVKGLKALDNPIFNSFFANQDKKICYLPNNSKGNLYEDITRIDLNQLYPYIQIGLFNEGLIGEEFRDDIESIQWFLKNRKELILLPSAEYQKCKIHCNSLYMKIKSPYVVEYVNMFYNDLIQKYGDLIIYNDTDVLYLNINKVSFESKEWISELKDYSYDIQFINYFYIEERKRYIEQEESGLIHTKGFFRDEVKKQNLLNIVKREIRRRKLDKLGL